MATLELDKVSKSFKTGDVLSDVSLTTGDGETVVIFGPSGTGKTVLLRLIAGIEQPDSGEIRIDGKSLAGVPSDARGVGMAFQNFALYPHMQAYDNISSPLAARGMSKDALDTKVHSIAKLLKIDHVLTHVPKALSNGQKQRTALARALVAGPQVLLLDDPLRNVDAKLRYEMRLELPRLLAGFKSTTLYVTQDYKEAMALGHRIAVLAGGGLAQIATPEDIYLKPANVEIARLFGDPTINLLPSMIEMNGKGPSVRLADLNIPLDPAFERFQGRKVRVGIRPEYITIGREPQEGALKIEVVAVTPLNERVVTLFQLADGTECFSSAPDIYSSTTTRRHGLAYATVKADSILVFDHDQGHRIEAKAE
jgi:multiple sugar transport system ATP-binding protein